MKITLTYMEGRAVMTRVSADLAEAMHEVRKHCWNKSHVYVLPALAWRRILEELRAIGYGPRGGYAERTESLYSAIAKIADAVRAHELHPAFVDGRGVVGSATEIVPAFLSDDGTRSPYPPGRFAVLMPEHLISRGTMLTTWYPGRWSPGESPLHSEGFHLRFWVEGCVDLVEHRGVPEL